VPRALVAMRPGVDGDEREFGLLLRHEIPP
jgi:hypothetical protein